MGQRISLDHALALAKAGDPDAQYAVSAALHQAGQLDESLYWLRLAASRNVVPAQLTLAAMWMDGQACPRDLQQARDVLRPLAATEPRANLLLAELHGFAALEVGDRETGLRYLAAAARMGDAGALRQLALLAACHRRWDLLRPLLDAAARRGDPPAGHALACCYAEGIGGAPEPGHAVAISRSGLARGLYLARSLEQQLAPLPAPVAAPPELAVDWPAVAQAIAQLAADIPLPPAETLHESPRIRKLPGVIHPLVLDAVIDLAAPLVRRSEIVDARTGEVRADPMRTSSHVTLAPRQHDHVLEAIEHCISCVSGLPALHGEFLQILRYRTGEEFKPHVDYFNESGDAAYRSLADGGQRAQTVLLYLNEEYDGGTTSFPKLQLVIKGRRGDLLHFHNLAADGLGHKDSLHAGTPVARGEKWLLSKWIRSERYPPRLRW
ncbi:MAG TPA: 2OG-Fe(II) oxygenase [Kofleriaceae bacterium]|nr:2OG-Fe(II) oxygenase [Kofleriaceae bacterium]